MQRDPKKPPTYAIADVAYAVLIFYCVCFFLDARGLYNWTTKLPVSESVRTARHLAREHWMWMAKLGLEEPKHSLEHGFLWMQDAHPLLYPRTYAETVAHRRGKARDRRQLAIAEQADPTLKARREAATQLLEPDERVPDGAKPAVLILGDSIMMSVGPAIKKDVTERLGGAAVVKAKLATGLARPDVFDWIKELRRLTGRRTYDFVIMMFGTNDSQSFMENGEILTYGTEGWSRVYERRIESAMAAACSGARKGLWVGLPPMQSAVFQRKAMRINAMARKQAALHPCMEYVSLDPILGDERGGFVSYRTVDRHLVKVRMVDGIHVTAGGGTLISSSLLGLMSDGRATPLSH